MQKFAIYLLFENQDERVKQWFVEHWNDQENEVVTERLTGLADGGLTRVLFWNPEIQGYSDTIKVERVQEGVYSLLTNLEWTPQMVSSFATGFGDLFKITLTDDMELLYVRSINVEHSMLHILKG